MDKFACISVFQAVVKSGSFVQAARQLGLTKSGVSRSISWLEEALSVKLLSRTTRKLYLTEEGQLYFEKCEALWQSLQETEEIIGRKKADPQGRIKVHLPGAFGRQVVIPVLDSFHKLYPKVQVVLSISDHEIDLVKDGFDLCVKIGELEDSSLVAKRIAKTHSVTVASPSYLIREGKPKTPQELSRHECINFILPHATTPWIWKLKRGTETLELHHKKARLWVTDASSGVEAAVAGLGIFHVGSFLVRELIASGKLAAVLTDWECEGPPISVVYLPNRYLPFRTRIFIEWLAGLPALGSGHSNSTSIWNA